MSTYPKPVECCVVCNDGVLKRWASHASQAYCKYVPCVIIARGDPDNDPELLRKRVAELEAGTKSGWQPIARLNHDRPVLLLDEDEVLHVASYSPHHGNFAPCDGDELIPWDSIMLFCEILPPPFTAKESGVRDE